MRDILRTLITTLQDYPNSGSFKYPITLTFHDVNGLYVKLEKCNALTYKVSFSGYPPYVYLGDTNLEEFLDQVGEDRKYIPKPSTLTVHGRDHMSTKSNYKLIHGLVDNA